MYKDLSRIIHVNHGILKSVSQAVVIYPCVHPIEYQSREEQRNHLSRKMSPSMLFYFYLTLLLIRTSRQSKVKSIEVKNLRRQMKLTETDLENNLKGTRNVDLLIKSIKDRINHELKGENQTIDKFS
ncbi:hypothetical protein KSF78_0008435 [Schistosoma japonicum]|nr:hypothetical protein KSF78_0008435 [Schistosoma japonicum]